MKRHCFVLDLIDDPELITEYEKYHEKVWPEILESIHSSGITDMQIYRFQNRLFMIMDTCEHFSFKAKDKADNSNVKVQEWEKLMWKYQQALPGSKPGEKWQPAKRIFQL